MGSIDNSISLASNKIDLKRFWNHLQKIFSTMNASEIILESKSSSFDLYNRISCSMIRLDLKPIFKIKKSYVENALIFMPSLLPLCLGLTIWVSPELFDLVGSRTIWSLLNRLFSEWFIESNKPCSDQAISHSTNANMFWLSKKNMFNKKIVWSPCPDRDCVTRHTFKGGHTLACPTWSKPFTH